VVESNWYHPDERDTASKCCAASSFIPFLNAAFPIAFLRLSRRHVLALRRDFLRQIIGFRRIFVGATRSPPLPVEVRSRNGESLIAQNHWPRWVMWRSLGAGFGTQLDGPAGPKRGASVYVAYILSQACG
jgi:hypothetical protein